VTRRLISSRYVWKGLSTDVTAWAKACLGCQWAKVHRHVQVPLQHIPVPTCRFSHIHVDLVGPLRASKGFTYLFTIIDRTFCWPEAIPIAATSTVDCANALFKGWVSRFGVPAVITSDRRTQFISSLWATLCSLIKIQLNQTIAYHPQSKGMVERFHRRLKDALRACCAATNWVNHLPWVLLGLCAADREDDSSTPAQAVFGSPLILHGQFLDSPELPPKKFLSNFLKHWTLSAAKHTSTRHNTAAARRLLLQLPNDLTCAPTVFLRRDRQVPLLQPLYDDTYAVIRRSLHQFTLGIGGKEDKVSTLDSSPAPTLQHRLHCPGSGAARPPLSNSVISPRQGLRRPAGDTSPHSNQ
jgi:transposase InsO family protein